MTVVNPEPCPEVVSGLGTVTGLTGLVEDGKWERALLVCGKRSFTESGADRVLDPLAQVTSVDRFSDFEPNTSATDLFSGVQKLETSDPDVVIGVGGGSAMDLAKLMCVFDGTSDFGTLEAAIRSGSRIESRRRALILVPTTSGTGSEATHFATVYVDREKFSVAGNGLRPDAVILDPSLSMTASPYQRASSGIDAVAQAIESSWAAAATPTSRRFARRALRYLLPNIEAFVHAPSTESASAMSIGSHLAGRAIDISKTTAAHALSYAITQEYGVSHGHAVGLTLGGFIEAHADPAPELLQPGVDPDQHASTMRDIIERLDASDGQEASDRFADLMARVGLDTSLASFGIDTPDRRADLAASVNPERLSNNPVRFEPANLWALLDRAG